MQRFFRQSSFFRTALAVVVVFGLLLQPVLGSLGDLHDFEHAVAAVTDHGHAHHDGHDAATGSGGEDAPGEPTGAHSLLHQAGLTAPMALADPWVLMPGLAPDDTRPRQAAAASPPTARLAQPFRPPIG